MSTFSVASYLCPLQRDDLTSAERLINRVMLLQKRWAIVKTLFLSKQGLAAYLIEEDAPETLVTHAKQPDQELIVGCILA